MICANWNTIWIKWNNTQHNKILPCNTVYTEVLTQVADIIQIPPAGEKYITLKSRLIDIFTDNKENNLKKHLSEVEQEDRKPSVLLN